MRTTWTAALGLCAVACSTPSAIDGGHDARTLDAPDALDARSDAADAFVDAAPADGGGATDPLDPSLAPTVDTNPAHYPANVWVTGPLAKVTRDATPPAGAARWALVSAARNEFESFQVHVHADARPIALGVTVSDLVDARSGRRIAAADHVTVSREEYLHITQLSDANGVGGYVPDPLIPTRDRYVHEPRNAFPAMVPTGQNRSAWIDVLVPADAPSGYYTGSVTVTDGGATIATLPVRLAVWDFALPSTATLSSAFGMAWDSMCVQAYGSYTSCGMYPGAAGDADHGVELTHVANAEFFLDHRVTVGDTVYAGPSGGDWTHFDALYGPLMNGTAPTVLAGARLTSMRYMQSLTNATQIGAWVSHFGAVGWGSRLFFYGCDEPPNGCGWTETLDQAHAIHAASAQARYLLTIDYANASSHGLTDDVDIMTPVVDQVDPHGGPSARPMYDAWLARPGKTLWWYQSCDEHESCSNGTAGGASSTWPSYMVDASPVRNRVFQWLAYLYGVTGELYYQADFCWQMSCGGGTDPWNSVYAFGGNGDGTLFYPGTPAHIGGTTPVPVSSVRLELIRDGMEDYEYLHLLASMGDDAFAQATSHTIITNASTFDNDPDHYLAARAALGERLHHMAHP